MNDRPGAASDAAHEKHITPPIATTPQLGDTVRYKLTNYVGVLVAIEATHDENAICIVEMRDSYGRVMGSRYATYRHLTVTVPRNRPAAYWRRPYTGRYAGVMAFEMLDDPDSPHALGMLEPRDA